MQPFVARVSVWRTVLIISGALLFMVAGCWMVGGLGEQPVSTRYSASVVAVIGWFSVVFSGVCAFIWARRLVDKEEQLRISDSGIRWKQWSNETIPWSEIVEVAVWRFRGQKSIILVLRDPHRYPSRTLLGKMASANRALTGGDIPITTTGLDKSFDETMAAIHAFSRPSVR